MMPLAFAACFIGGMAAAGYLAHEQCYGLAFVALLVVGGLSMKRDTDD